jgi:hypothetical protein
MALPKIKHPTYPVVIPSTQQQVNIRPFTVQEEKLLLMARSSDSTEDAISAVKQIVNNCIQEPVDVDKLATFDIEYLFIKLRAKSVGEMVDLEYNDPETNENIKFKLNLDDVEIKTNPDHKNKFNIAEDIGVVMRYPTLSEVSVLGSNADDQNNTMEVLRKCIDKIYDDETIYNDFTEKEMNEFINSLPIDSMQKIRNFFETMPSVEHDIELKNKDGKPVVVKLKGLNNFFR